MRRALDAAVEVSHFSATVSDTKTFQRSGVRMWAWGRFFLYDWVGM